MFETSKSSCQVWASLPKHVSGSGWVQILHLGSHSLPLTFKFHRVVSPTLAFLRALLFLLKSGGHITNV